MNQSLRAKLLLNACKAPINVWKALQQYEPEMLELDGETFWQKLGLRPSSCSRLQKLLDERDWPEREMDRVDAFGAHFITVDDSDYPARLKDLASPPIGIYIKGTLDSIKPCLAIVGTRRCSHYGHTVAETVGRAAARVGHQVISGGAKGIDKAGHCGCLAEGGTTVAVFGTAIDQFYPVEHRDLFLEIAEKGALISEYPMGTGGDPWRFPARNRLIVGLCNRVVVVESPKDGGAMITARLASNMGREVWCVPGRITEEIAKGTNALIGDGALALTDIDDFTSKISGKYGQLLLNFGQPSQQQLSENERLVLELLQRKGGRMLDDLMGESGLGLAEVQSCLATLSASSLVYPSGPGRYSAGL